MKKNKKIKAWAIVSKDGSNLYYASKYNKKCKPNGCGGKCGCDARYWQPLIFNSPTGAMEEKDLLSKVVECTITYEVK